MSKNNKRRTEMNNTQLALCFLVKENRKRFEVDSSRVSDGEGQVPEVMTARPNDDCRENVLQVCSMPAISAGFEWALIFGPSNHF